MEVIWDVIPAIIVIMGPVLASFFMVQTMRGNDLTRVNGDRSACDQCGAELKPWELVPIFSFIFLRGKCAHCGKPINPRLFLGELLGLITFGILAAGVAKQSVGYETWSLIGYTLFGFIICTCLLYLALHDGLTYSIPTLAAQISLVVAVGANVVALLIRLINPTALPNLSLGRADNLIAGAIFALLFWSIIKLTNQRAMGIGDVVVAAIMGLSLGWPGVVSSFYVMIISASGVGILMAWRRKRFKGTLLPFVPFMFLGFIVAYTWGYEIFKFLFVFV